MMFELNALLLIQKAVVGAKCQEIIVVGFIKDSRSGRITYGGKRFRPFRNVLGEPDGQTKDVDLINVNVV